MNNYRSLSDRRNANWIMRSFAVLFVIFVFTNLVTSYKDIIVAIGTAAYTKTAIPLFNIEWLIALVATLFIWLVQPLTRALARTRINRIVVTYVPAFLVMFLFVFMGDHLKNNSYWVLWLGEGLIILDFVLLWIYIFVRSLRRVDPRHYSTTGIYHYVPWAISNAIFFGALVFATIWSIDESSSLSFKFPHKKIALETSSDTVKAKNDKEEQPLRKNDGENSLEKTIAFNTMLYKQHRLGDLLFSYEQKYKSGGLGRKDTYVLGTKDSVAYDYHMAGLLLDKDLKAFAADLKHYHEFHTDSFPAHYTEAYIMYKYMNPRLRIKIHNPYFNARFRRYMKYSKHLKSQKYEFGKTFWWYFEHQD